MSEILRGNVVAWPKCFRLHIALQFASKAIMMVCLLAIVLDQYGTWSLDSYAHKLSLFCAYDMSAYENNLACRSYYSASVCEDLEEIIDPKQPVAGAAMHCTLQPNSFSDHNLTNALNLQCLDWGENDYKKGLMDAVARFPDLGLRGWR